MLRKIFLKNKCKFKKHKCEDFKVKMLANDL